MALISPLALRAYGSYQQAPPQAQRKNLARQMLERKFGKAQLLHSRAYADALRQAQQQWQNELSAYNQAVNAFNTQRANFNTALAGFRDATRNYLSTATQKLEDYARQYGTYRAGAYLWDAYGPWIQSAKTKSVGDWYRDVFGGNYYQLGSDQREYYQQLYNAYRSMPSNPTQPAVPSMPALPTLNATMPAAPQFSAALPQVNPAELPYGGYVETLRRRLSFY